MAIMITISMYIEGSDYTPKAIFNNVLDGGSGIRQVESWDHLNVIARANQESLNNVICDYRTFKKLVELWGMPTI